MTFVTKEENQKIKATTMPAILSDSKFIKKQGLKPAKISTYSI